MALGTTPVPYHTGGRGAVRTLDKGFHRIVRRCDIDRFVSVGVGDSGVAVAPVARQTLRRLEAALNHDPRNPSAPHPRPMKVVPGTVNVRARDQAEASVVPQNNLQGSFIPEVWKVEPAPLTNLPVPVRFPSAAAEPYVGPDGHVQVFPAPQVPGGPPASITYTLVVPMTRAAVGYVKESVPAGRLLITITRTDNTSTTSSVNCGPSAAGPVGPRVRVVTSSAVPIKTVKVEREDTNSSLKAPRVLAYHFDLNDTPNQIMHANCGRGGSTAIEWDNALSPVNVPLNPPALTPFVVVGRANLWWRLLASINNPVGVDLVSVNVGGNDPENARSPASAAADVFEAIRKVLTALLKDHATAWPLVEAAIEGWPPDPANSPRYSYPACVLYSLPHDQAFGPPPDYFNKSVAYEAALNVGPFQDDTTGEDWGPLPVDVISFQSDKTLPGVFAPGVDPDPAESYLDPRRVTRDGVHPNELGAAKSADLSAQAVVFAGLPIGVYDLTPFLDPDPRPPNWEGPCPSPTEYDPLPPGGSEGGGPSSGEDVPSGEEAPTGEEQPAPGDEPTEDGWAISDVGLTIDEGT